jgi:hypothetical protein
MKVTCVCVTAVVLIALAGGCETRVNLSWLANHGASISRTNDELTVKVNDGSVTEGSGTQGDEERPVAAFRNVAAHHGIQVLIDDASDNSLTVEADDNLLPLVETKVENETLLVRVTGNLKTRKPIRVHVSTKQLSKVSATSSASVKASKASDARVHVQAESSGQVAIDEVQGEQIELTATSSGDVSTKSVEGKKLHVTVNSSGRVSVAGKIDEQRIEVSSSGNYNAGQLDSRLIRVDCNSAGSVLVHATDEIVGSASSAGSVRYLGSPAKVSVSTDSAGSVGKAEN